MLRDRIPQRYRDQLALQRVHLRRPTARLRQLPDFVVIGAQRAGTSSLYRYLGAHPEVRKPLRKEVKYFTREWAVRSSGWYRAHFPLARPGIRTFEATPQYLTHPRAPERLAGALPHARIVVTLRDPVERALSHHRHSVRLGHEPLPAEAAITAEPGRIADDLRALEVDPEHHPGTLFQHGYVTRSRYGEQLERWLHHVDRDRIHVFWFDEFLTEPTAEWDRLLGFLDLGDWRPPAFANWSSRTEAVAVDDRLRHEVRTQLADDTTLLATLVGRALPWAP